MLVERRLSGRCWWLAFALLAAVAVGGEQGKPDGLRLTLRPLFLTAQAVEVEVQVGELPQPPTRIELALLPLRGERAVAQQTLPFPPEARSVVARLSTAGMEAGKYRLRAQVYAAPPAPVTGQGTRLASATQPLIIPPRPDWWGSKRGLEETVPPPWTPLKVARDEGQRARDRGTPSFRVECWGRTYRFAGSPFPTAITNQGKPLLAAPVELRAALYGQPFTFNWSSLECLHSSPAKAVLLGRGQYQEVELEVRTTVEFDGLLRFDLRLQPNTHYLTALFLRIPLRREWAEFVYHWPPGWPHIDGTFPLPLQGWHSPFRHYLWVGNSNGGLCWFTESQQPFVPSRVTGEGERVIEIEPAGETVLLRFNFVRQATLPTFREWTATFGLLPTPVKPWPKDYHRNHVGIDAVYGMERAEFAVSSTVSYPAEPNLNIAQGTLEMWLRLEFEPRQEDAFILRPVRPYLATELFLEWQHDLGDQQGSGLRLRVLERRRQELLHLRVPLDWRRGEWHHLALTWGEELCLYADGTLVAQKPFTGLLAGRPGWDRYGSLLLGGSAVTLAVDELHLSRTVRPEFDLTQPPSADENTLLLDHLEGEDESTPLPRTKPERGAGGRLSDLAQFGEGKFGRALWLMGRRYGRSTFECFRQFGLKAVNLPEWWTQAQGTTETKHEERLRRFVRQAHRQGLKVLLYFGFEMSDAAPEWPWLQYELTGREPQPRTRLSIRSLSDPQAYYAIDHGAQPYQDYLIEGLAHLIRKYDIDGVYLDGTHLAGGCRNEYHGHCWYDAQGRPQGISFIWAARRLMKRMYRVIKAAKPDGLIYAHTSAVVLAPSLSFADFFYNGEQLIPLVRRAREEGYKAPAEIVPLTTFRVLFDGRPWGVPSHFHRGGFTLTEALSLSLLHDVFPAPYVPNRAGLERTVAIWRVYEEFGADEAEWHPYWEEPPAVMVEPEAVKVSFHQRRKEGQLLLIVSNLSPQPVTATVRLHPRRLGLNPPFRFEDALTGESLSPAGNGTHLLLLVRPASFRLLWVRTT